MPPPAETHQALSRPLLALTGVMLVVAGALAWSTWSTNRLVATFVPQVQAAMQARLTVTQAHLWLEEIVSGDAGEDAGEVWRLLDSAEADLEALLQGAPRGDLVVLPVEDPLLRQHVEAALHSAQEFRRVGMQRVGTELAGAGSDLDLRFDRVYEDFDAMMALVATELHDVVDAAMRRFVLLQSALVVLVLAMFAAVILLLRRKEHSERDAHFRQLQATLDEVERNRQALEKQHRLQSALVDLNGRLQGVEDAGELATRFLRFLAEHAGVHAAACWAVDGSKRLVRLAGHAEPASRHAVAEQPMDAGVPGHVARSGQPAAFDVPDGYWRVASGLGESRPGHVRVLPVLHDGRVLAVAELAWLHGPGEETLRLLDASLAPLSARLNVALRAGVAA